MEPSPAGPQAAGEALPVTTKEIDVPPPIGGGASAPPLIPGGRGPSIDVWRAIERGNITGEGAQDLLRKIVDTQGDRIPGLRGLAEATGGKAASAGTDPTYRAGVVNLQLEEVQKAERTIRMAELKSAFPFKSVGSQGEVILASGKKVAFRDLAEDVLAGGTKFGSIAPEEAAWIQDGKRLIDDLAAQYGAQTGEDIATRGPFFWPSVVTDDAGKVTFRTAVGAKQTPFKKRVIEEMQSGIEHGVPYADPLTTLEHYAKSLQKVTRDDIFKQVILEDDIGRIINPKSLLDDELVEATNAARIAYRDAQRDLRALQRERLRLQNTKRRTDKGTNAANIKAKKVDVTTTRSAWNSQKRKYRNEMDKARTFATSGERGERSGFSLGPGLSNVIFSEEDIVKLEGMASKGSRVLGIAGQIASIPRFILTGALDVGQFGIQMVTLMRRPGRFASAVGGGFRDMAFPKNFTKYLATDPAVKRVAPFGADFGGVEFTEAVRSGGLLSDIPVVSSLLKIAPRGFDGMLVRGKVGMADAMLDIGRKAGEDVDDTGFRIVRYANTMLGSTHTKTLGVSATQRQFENAFGFFSARYTRSIPAAIGYMFSKGVVAKDARESLAVLLMAGAGTFYGLARGSGLSHKETVERLDPRSGGKFMSIPIGGNEYGFGSGWRSYTRFLGDITVQDNWTFDSWSEGAVRNPIVQMLRSRTSPITGTLIDFITGEDFLGNAVSIDDFMDSPELLLDYLQDSFLPLNVEAIIEARGGLGGKLGAGLVETIGGRAFPRSPFTLLSEAKEGEFQRLKAEGTIPFANFDSFDALKESNSAAALRIEESAPVLAAQERLDEEQRFRPQSPESEGFDLASTVRDESVQKQEDSDDKLKTFFRSGGDTGISPKDWQDARRDRQRELFAQREGIFRLAGIEFEEREAPEGSVNAAINKYFSVNVDNFSDQATEEIDWSAFFEARERALSSLTASQRGDVDNFLNRFETDTERAFRDIESRLDEYFTLEPNSENPVKARIDTRKRELLRLQSPEIDSALYVSGVTGVTSVFPNSRQQVAADILEIFGIRVSLSDIPVRRR